MLALTLTADLAGVTELEPIDTAESPFYFNFKESNEISGSRGEANFVWRCKMCKRESTATIAEAPAKYVQQSPPKTQQIIKIDCRGLEFTEFKADGEWAAVGSDSSTKFSAIELDQGEWYDYDEKAGEEVSIKDIKWSIHRA